jgi:hypothetical protein
MFKITKYKICVAGMLLGIGLISLLPFMGLADGVRVPVRDLGNKTIIYPYLTVGH